LTTAGRAGGARDIRLAAEDLYEAAAQFMWLLTVVNIILTNQERILVQTHPIRLIKPPKRSYSVRRVFRIAPGRAAVHADRGHAFGDIGRLYRVVHRAIHA